MTSCYGALFSVALFPAAATQSALVSWSPSADTNVVAYNIYYVGASGTYTNMISVGDVTNVTVSGLLNGATYYFAAKAVSSSGAQSAFSTEAAYTVPGAAATLSSAGSARGGFSFTVNGISGYQYVIQASTNLVNWEPLETNTCPFSFFDSKANGFSRRYYRAVYYP